VILAGDVGGTKTVLALFKPGARGLTPRGEATFPSKSAGSLEELALRFLEASGRPALRAACFGVAGAVVEGRVKTTNLPWELSEASLADALHVPRVRLLNDLEAAAYGVLNATPEALEPIQPGAARTHPATMALIAAGTGLGEAIMPWDGARHLVLASEGGHADFAPRTELEGALWEFLRREFGHVSCERVLSGPGLQNVYRFLRQHRCEPEPAWLTERLAAGDPSAAVAEAGLAGRDPVCAEALTLFVSMYGAEAGNLALKALAVGGVFVGGGIAPKILPKLKEPHFTEAFVAKGRFGELMRSIPVYVVTEPRIPLFGAADRARALHRPGSRRSASALGTPAV
jgi:glucokinase